MNTISNSGQSFEMRGTVTAAINKLFSTALYGSRKMVDIQIICLEAKY
jgi:hypothetical protein